MSLGISLIILEVSYLTKFKIVVFEYLFVIMVFAFQCFNEVDLYTCCLLTEPLLDIVYFCQVPGLTFIYIITFSLMIYQLV